MGKKVHPYLTREFWVEKQKNFTYNPIFSDNGNKIVKDLIDKIVADSFIKEDNITR